VLQAALRRSEPGGNGSDEIGRENAALRRLVVAYQHLSSLAAQDADLQTVTELIAESVGTAVALVDQRLVVTAACNTAVPEETWLCGQPATHPGIAQVVEAVSRTRRAVRIPDLAGTGTIIVAPVPVGDEVAAFLLALGGVCHSAVEIARSYDGARRAREIVVRAGKTGTAVAMEDLGGSVAAA
jgi:hypothetical protein